MDDYFVHQVKTSLSSPVTSTSCYIIELAIAAGEIYLGV